MLRYPILFIHVASAMGIFAALGVEAAVFFQLRGGSGGGEEVRTAMRSYALVRVIGAIGLVGTLLSGIYLATTTWRWRGAWIGMGFLGLLLTAGIGGTATRVAVARLQAPGGTGYNRGVALLGASLLARLAILIAVVFLMTVKPAVGGSVAAMSVGVVAALISAATSLRARRTVRSGSTGGGA